VETGEVDAGILAEGGEFVEAGIVLAGAVVAGKVEEVPGVEQPERMEIKSNATKPKTRIVNFPFDVI
jgi:hypothetical protein